MTWTAKDIKGGVVHLPLGCFCSYTKPMICRSCAAIDAQASVPFRLNREKLAEVILKAEYAWREYDRNANLQQHSLRMNKDSFIADAIISKDKDIVERVL